MAKIVYRTLRQTVEEQIRSMIISGAIQPGERIVEQDIAETLKISRGPVREALRQFEQEGLVTYARNVGCSVRKFTDLDVFEVYLIRANLEILAVRLCEGKLSAENRTRMKALLELMSQSEEPGKADALVEYDNEFHGLILQQAGLSRLHTIWSGLNVDNMVIYYQCSSDHAAAKKRMRPIHQALLDAYESGNVAHICREVMDHYMLTVRRRLQEEQSETVPEQFRSALDDLFTRIFE